MIEKERYPDSWKDYPSVTEVLNVIAKPNLIYWFKSRTKEEIDSISNKAINIGKEIHSIISRIEDGKKIEIDTQYPEEMKNVINSYFSWKKENSIEVISSEVSMLNKEFGYKGTLDRLARYDGKLILIEWKTAKAIYPEYKLQVAAYKKAYETLYKDKISEVRIIRLGKDKVEYENKLIEDDMSDLFKVFLNALKICKWIKSEKNNDKKEEE